MGLFTNATSVLKSPQLAFNYLSYVTRPEKTVSGIRLRNFSCFSEYLNSDFLRPAEHLFLSTYPFAPGAIIDVGAHIGFVSLVMAQRYADRTICAFEPSPTTFKSLIGNLALNEVSNIRAYDLAIADHEGTVAFNADPRYRATNRIAVEADPHVIATSCTTLDAFVESCKIEEIALLKVDVEGHEASVLAGADRALERTHVVFYEVCPSNNLKVRTDIQTPFRQLREHGFGIFRFDNESLVPALLSDLDTLILENWVAVKSSH